MRLFKIDGVNVTDDGDCYVIAEIGHNHMGSVEECKRLFKAAKDAGADCVKLQKRDNRALFTKEMYDSPYNSENAYAPTYGTHREALEFNKEQYKELQKYAKELGITFFATAFDIPSAEFLEDLDVPAYKIASGDYTNTPLLKLVASYGKPMIISTGGARMEDVRRIYETVKPINPNFCILQCTSGYPPKYEELNLRVIETYRKEFPDVIIGFSAHDNGIAMSVAAYSLGARVVEKHFTMSRANKGTDHAFSLEPAGLTKQVRDLRRLKIAMGDGVKARYPSEEAPLFKMMKKIVAAKDLPAGTVLSLDNVNFKSPNDGLPPYKIYDLVGKKLKAAVAEDGNIDLDNLI